MAVLVKSYWFEVTPEPTEIPGEGVEVSPTPDGVETSTPDPDFVEVSEFLKNESSPSPDSQNENKETESKATETEALEEYTSRLDNISIQVGVIDVCLVLSLLISIIRQFIRVPR